MQTQDLEYRVYTLVRSCPAYAKELRHALDYIRPDAKSSLTKSRLVLEMLLIQVYVAEMGKEPRKKLLGDMLADNQFTRRIESRILKTMNGIRDWGNSGPHPGHVEPRDAIKTLDDLCEVFTWYLHHYKASDHLVDERGRAASVVSVLERPDNKATDATLRNTNERRLSDYLSPKILGMLGVLAVLGGLGIWYLLTSRDDLIRDPERPDVFYKTGSKEEVGPDEVEKLKD